MLKQAENTRADKLEQVRASIERNPRQMTMMLAREFDLPEAEVLRLMPAGVSTELDAGQWEEILIALEALGDVHVIVSNGSTTIESKGSFGGFSKGGGFFNVQSGTLDMHIQHEKLAYAFAIRKPSHLSGVDTLSVQFYDRQGAASFKVFLTFGGSAPSEEREEQFKKIITNFHLD